MIEAVAGGYWVVATSLLYSIELAERAFDKAGRYPLSREEKQVLEVSVLVILEVICFGL